MTNTAATGDKPPLSNFARQLLQFLDRVEYRRIVHAEDLEEIGRLRYRSYRTRNVMHEAEVPSIVDDIDRDSHAFVYGVQDRKSTRLNSSHVKISYAVFCLKKKI